jgi:ketosteroid isomerase-like protein
MRNRLTWVLRERDGAWKVVHEHTSVPLDFETKAMLRDG